ncbi:MAG: CpcT/CpeT family chromophore lyase [Bacteroidota bacterium]
MKSHPIIYHIILFAILSMMLACSKPATQAEVQDEDPEQEMPAVEQLMEIMHIWPGTYNNDKQIAAAEKAGKDVWRIDDSGEGGYLQVQSHYIQLDLPEIAPYVLYVEEYRDHQPSETYRQRIYTLSVDDSLDMVRVKMWPFKDKKKFVGAWEKPDLLNSLSKEEISAYPDKCDLLVNYTEEGYHMYMNGKDCAFGDKVFNYEVMLKGGLFSYRDKISSLAADSVLTTAADFDYKHLDKIIY